ncbi:uncharacterized protein LOC127102780 [Lathyrus oleraceus]|uniref:uncharacterized protein LOC127102780 n=1 Tax=Pisum sativum TaxID=3888 RepID=UPI0021CE3908|nr:uncharacterized protein LOC127102780 [Pisum sativum]
MEMLQVIRAKMDTQTIVVSEVAGPTLESQPARTVPSTLPPFGLPYGFTPQPEVVHGVMQSTQQTVPLPLTTEAHPMVYTFASPIVHTRVQSYFEDQQYAPEMSDEEEERHEDIKGIKDNSQILEKRLRAMEGDQVFSDVAREMCLVSSLVIPTKFKTPEFDRYEGHTCPKSHLIMYYRKMVANVEDDKLMIHFFQDSLKGAPSKWYLRLDQSRIQCFQDLFDAFIKHYKYNMDMAQDGRELLNMSQKDNESFKEYAQRWREMASQVEPPLAEKELADWFMDIVQPIFFERMVGSVSVSFSDLVAVGIKVELHLKNGKMISAAGTSNNNNAKKFPGNFHKKRKERRMMCRPAEEGVNHGESNNENSLNNNQHTL